MSGNQSRQPYKRVKRNPRPSSRKSQRERRHRQCLLRFESLEPRRLLAAELISVTPFPSPIPPEAGNDYSSNPVLSGNGRFVAFQSHATNLVSNDTNGTQDVFVRDLALGTTALVSVNSAGTDSGRCTTGSCASQVTAGSFYPSISDDGRYIAFLSFARDLIAGVTIDDVPNVFVRDRDADQDGIFDETGPGESTTRLLSRAVDGTSAGAEESDAVRPVISGNGLFVSFVSFADDLDVSDPTIVDTNDNPISVGADVYLAPVDGSPIARVNVDGTGIGTGSLGGTIAGLSITGSGGAVSFASTNTGLVSAATGTFADTNGAPDVFVGSGNNSVEIVSVNALGTGPGNAGSREGVISRNGRHVAFFSSATDLVSGATDTNGAEDLFVRDLKTGVTTLISRAADVGGISTANGATPPSTLLDNDVTAGPGLSDDGRYIVFRSSASNLVDPASGIVDSNSVTDVFWHDRDPDEDGRFDEPGQTTTRLVSINAAGTAAADHTGTGITSAGSSTPAVSRDGRFVAFASTGRDLIPGGTPFPGGHVYLRDMWTGRTTLISETTTGVGVGPDGTTPFTRPLSISRTGEQIAFQSDQDASLLDATVVDPPSGAPVPFAEIDVFVGTPPTDIVLGRNFAIGSDIHRQSFRIRFDDSSPFTVGYYLSDDEQFDASDTLLGSIPVTAPDDLTVDGNRFVTAMIGASIDEIPFPGAATADLDSDYFLLTVADPSDGISEFDADPFAEDNTSILRGVYHAPGGAVLVQGNQQDESVQAEVNGATLSVQFARTGFPGTDTFTYDVSDVTETRIRTHGGNDSITGSDLMETVFGGDGNDFIDANGGNDVLFGGPGKDRLLGGDGDDVIDGGDGPDVLLGGPGSDTLVDGPGDDLLDAGPDDDVVMALPGSDNIYIGGEGIDTISFADDDMGGLLFLDSTAKQVYDPDGNTVTIKEFEHYVGSAFDDQLFAGPLSGIERHFDGGDGQDTLTIDASDNVVVNDGTRLSFPGTPLGDIVYQGFEQVIVQRFRVTTNIIDNGDTGFNAVGFTTINDPGNPQGFDGDIAFADPNDSTPSVATWTFDNIPSGFYSVAATWTSAPDRATNVPHRVLDGNTEIDALTVNQEVLPQEFQDQGEFWQNLSIVQITGNSLTVEITDTADDFVIADAIRIAPVEDAWIVDDTATRTTTSPGPPVVREVAGILPLQIDSTILAFRADNGGPEFGDLPPQNTLNGTRTVNWDEVNDLEATPNFLPGDFYNVGSFRRGVVVQTRGPGIQVSKSPTAGPDFLNLNPTYLTEFQPATLDRLMSPIDDNVVDFTFFVPGTNTPASVRSFGAVFSDVDLPFVTKIDLFGVDGNLLRSQAAPALPVPASETYSFSGVTYQDPVIARARITLGNGALQSSSSPNDLSQGGSSDLVVLDDIIFGEPVALPSSSPVDGFQSDCVRIVGPGFLGDQHPCLTGQTATWSFDSVPTGNYLISTTWDAGSGRSDQVTYSIDGSDVVINQQQPPSDFTFADRPWQRIAKINVDASGIVPDVSIQGTGPQTFVADAVQLAPASDLQVRDPFGNVVTNGGTVHVGQIPLDDTGLAQQTFTFEVFNSPNSGLLRLDNLTSTPGPISVSEFSSETVPASASTTFDSTIQANSLGTFQGTISFESNDFADQTFSFQWVADVVPDTTPPTISILSPDDGASFIEGTTVPIRVDPQDDGALRSVEFIVNGQPQTVINESPFDANITLPLGVAATIVARAHDVSGNTSDSDPIILNLDPDLPPTIQITSPANGQGVFEGSTIQVAIDASDDVDIDHVSLLVNGVLQNQAFSEPFLFDVVLPMSPDPISINACAEDGRGQQTCDSIEVETFDPLLNDASFGNVVIGPETGRSPRVHERDRTGNRLFEFIAYDPSFTGGVRVASGDVNGDGTADIITAPGPGGSPHVKVFDGATGESIHSFFAYPPSFSGGVFVASGDVTGDGIDDIITGTGPGGASNVKVFDGQTGALRSSFHAFDPSFTGGVRVGAGDVTGDGQADIIVGAGPGGGPRIRVFDGHTSSLLPLGGLIPDSLIHADFFAFDPTFQGGVFISAGDVNQDSLDDIVIGADSGGAADGGQVKVLDGQQIPAIPPGGVLNGVGTLHQFPAYDAGFSGGVRVASGDVNNDGIPDIITSAGPDGESRIRAFDGSTGSLIGEFDSPAGPIGSFVGSGKLPSVDVVGMSNPQNSISVEGNDVVVRDGSGNELLRRPATDSRPIRLNASPTTDDVLTVRTLGSDLASRIIFDGGLGGFDSVVLQHPVGVPPLGFLHTAFPNPLTTNYSTNRSDPDDLDATFVDLEPIADSVATTDREFVFSSTDDNVLYNTGISVADSLLRIDSQNSEVVDFLEPSGVTHIQLGSGSDQFVFDLPISLLPSVDGSDGTDTFVLDGSERHLDLTDPSISPITNIEVIDVIGQSPNTLTVDRQSVIDATDIDNLLEIVHDDDDTILYAGPGWDVQVPILANGGLRHVLVNDGARVEVTNQRPHQNPFQPTDVNFDEATTPRDALFIINSLAFSETGVIDFTPPTSPEEIPDRYVDVNGDRRGTALDALFVINFIARQTVTGGQSGESVTIATPMLAAPAQPNRSPLAIRSIDGTHDLAFAPDRAEKIVAPGSLNHGRIVSDVTVRSGAAIATALHPNSPDSHESLGRMDLEEPIDPAIWDLALDDLLR